MIIIFGKLPASDDYFISSTLFEGFSFDIFAIILLIPYFLSYPQNIKYGLSFINHKNESISSPNHKEYDMLFLVFGIFGFLTTKLFQFITETQRVSTIGQMVLAFVLLGLLFIITILLLFSQRCYNCTSFMRNSPLHPKYVKGLSSSKTVAFLGDSLTHGTMSYDWVSDFKKNSRTNVINAAYNGNTSVDVLKQTEEVVPFSPNFAVILCGTNDVFSVTHPELRFEKTCDKNIFSDNMKEIIKKFINNRVKVIIVSIPPIFEDLDGNENIMVVEYNKILKELCKENDCVYIPFYETLTGILKMVQKEYQKEKLKDTNVPKENVEIEMTEISIEENPLVNKYIHLFKKDFNVSTPALEHLNFVLFLCKQYYIQHILLEKPFDQIAYESGLLLTFDGIHLHCNTAKILSDLISNEITW